MYVKNKMQQVIKRDGLPEAFDYRRIKTAVDNAFSSAGQEQSKPMAILMEMDIKEAIGKLNGDIHVEQIQDIVERYLMKHYPEVARKYILYREEHKKARLIGDKLKYIHRYEASGDTATNLSNTDDNANSACKNVATLEGEVYKDINRLIQMSQMKELLAEIGSPYRDQYAKDLTHHIIYQHDASNSPVLKVYCSAYSLYPLLVDGTTNIDGTKNKAPKHLSSFCGQFCNLVFLLSAQKKGAGAYGEFFNFFSYFCEKEWGKDYYRNADKLATSDACLDKRTIGDEIDQYFQQVTHYINQPAGNRSNQSPFTNFNVFDSYYWHTMFDGFTFPDGSKPNWDAVNWLQKRYMRWLNDERTHTLLTFPVMTVLLLTDGKDVKDKEYKDFVATQWAAGDSFFVYLSENADSVASCCFSADTDVLWKSGGRGVQLSTLKELYDLGHEDHLRIFHNGSWVEGKAIKLPNRKMYKVTTCNDKELCLTDNHVNVTLRGEVPTTELTTDDYLMFNTQVLQATPENDRHLTYEEGFVVGMFLGDGSFGTDSQGVLYETGLSLGEDRYCKGRKTIEKCLEQLGIDVHICIHSVHDGVYPVTINSKQLASFIQNWTHWRRGTCSSDRQVNLDCLLQSAAFRKGILDGWHDTFGSNPDGCYTTSRDLAKGMEAIITSLGMSPTVDISNGTKKEAVMRDGGFIGDHPLYSIRWPEQGDLRASEDSDHSWLRRNNSIYFRIKSIEELDYSDEVYCIECKNQEEPYFTLPSGLITHNCRLRNEVTENTFSSTTGLTGVQTGSCNVMTLNLNRIIQDWYSDSVSGSTEEVPASEAWANHKDSLKDYLEAILDRVYDYQKAYKTGLYKLDKEGMLPAMKAGYISLRKLYSTIGVNGLNEAARFLGMEVSNNPGYMEFCKFVLSTIKQYNKAHSGKDFMFNLELVPAESLGVKNYNWDKEDGYWVPEDKNLYNSYIYDAHDDTSILDKIAMQGGEVAKSIDGGQASHLNLEENLTKEQYLKLLEYAVEVGNSYITFNVPQTQCDDCGFIAKHPFDECPKCGSHKVTQWSRIIGYLRPVKGWSSARQEEFKQRTFLNRRNYANGNA